MPNNEDKYKIFVKNNHHFLVYKIKFVPLHHTKSKYRLIHISKTL